MSGWVLAALWPLLPIALARSLAGPRLPVRDPQAGQQPDHWGQL